MPTLPFPCICNCGFNTMDAREANEHIYKCKLNTMSKTTDNFIDQQAARMDTLKDAKSDDVVDSEEAMDYQLHLDAGLVPSGLDEEGKQQWIGTDAEWHLYTQLEIYHDDRQEDLPF